MKNYLEFVKEWWWVSVTSWGRLGDPKVWKHFKKFVGSVLIFLTLLLLPLTALFSPVFALLLMYMDKKEKELIDRQIKRWKENTTRLGTFYVDGEVYEES